MALKTYKGITFPVNPTYINTPDSIQLNPAGIAIQWKDLSGNNLHTTAGQHTKSNFGGVGGYTNIGNTYGQITLTTDPNTYTTAHIFQKVSPVSVQYLSFYYANNGVTDYINISENQITLALAGYTTKTVANPSLNIGSFLFVVVRYSQGVATYFFNSVSSSGSLTKVSSPSKVAGEFTIYCPNNNVDSPTHIESFKAYWNRYLTEAEVLSLSNYVYNITNGQVGDAPINTSLISNLQSQLGVI